MRRETSEINRDHRYHISNVMTSHYIETYVFCLLYHQGLVLNDLVATFNSIFTTFAMQNCLMALNDRIMAAELDFAKWVLVDFLSYLDRRIHDLWHFNLVNVQRSWRKCVLVNKSTG